MRSLWYINKVMSKTKKQNRKRVKSNKGGVGIQKMGYGEAGSQATTRRRKEAAISQEKSFNKNYEKN